MRRVAVLILLAVLAVACETSSDNGSGIDTGLGTQDASGDVTLGSCKTQLGGIITCKLDIVNSSDGTSDYYVEGNVLDKSGANIGTANTFVNKVDGGQAARAELTGTFTGPAKKVDGIEITTVQRTAS